MAGRKGRSGGRPLPTAVKKARGTYRKDRERPNAVVFPLARLTPPSWLDAIALAEWRRIVPLLDTVRVLTDPDLTALSNYCVAVSVSVRAAKEVNKSLMIPVRKGSKMMHISPYIKVAREARAEALRYAIEFGLTPAARSRVVSQPSTTDDGKKKKDVESDDDVPLFGPPKLVVG